MQVRNIKYLKFVIMFFCIHHSFAGITPNRTIFPNTIDYLDYYGFEGWGRKQAITIQASEISDDLINFPFLVTLDHLNEEVVDAGAYSALNGGGDIRFSSDSNGNIPLAVEIVNFVTGANPSGRKCQIWVKVPSVSSITNTTIYIWYNKAGESQPANSSTYGSEAVWSDYEAVWHMDSLPTGTIVDATGNGHNLSSSGSMSAANLVTGAIGGAILFDGVDDQLVLSSSLSYGSTLTFSAIFNWSGNGEYNGILANKSPWSGFWVNSGGGGRTVFYNGTSQVYSSSGAFTPNSTTKYDFVATSGDYRHFYHGAGDVAGTNTVNTGSFAYIGSEGNSAYFSGWIDEIRLTSLNRSQAWLLAEQGNQFSPSSFATKGVSSNGTTGSSGGGGSLWSENNGNLYYDQGNVGIGTMDPGTDKLAVNGKIRAREIKVETANWPDYVFEKGYRLRSLGEVKKFIEEKGHLPNMPSAGEVESNGQHLGEMNRLLLEKVEELTLYTIQLKEDLLNQSKANQAYRERLERLERLIIRDSNKIEPD